MSLKNDSRNDRFNKYLRHLDEDKIISDAGESVERLINALDWTPEFEKKLSRMEIKIRREYLTDAIKAVLTLLELKKEHLINTLLLVMKHKNNQEDSICEIARLMKNHIKAQNESISAT